ncbi:MAG: hypothetical protein JWO45_2074 [Spartobacteria bacterium]|nr:hypothetical protein [Spartobacteria bacterium]
MNSRSHDPNKKVVLFHRDFRKFTGGHLKVWHYFDHVLSSTSYEPRIAFTPESIWDATNPWSAARSYLTDWDPKSADILFLAGSDWRGLPETKARDYAKPIINLVQHPRHADPRDELYKFLPNRAVRICVSEQVADAVNATGRVNGPVFVIPNGIELGSVPGPKAEDARAVDVLICGLKAPDLAREVAKTLTQSNRRVMTLIDWIPRDEYLARLADARIAVTLPRPIEGFYLPALEAMACGATVVCPDCVGNRDFCKDGFNCFRPRYDADAIANATIAALDKSQPEMEKMLANSAVTVSQHSLETEREAFLSILERLDELWH